MNLETEHLIIRAIRPEDLDDLYAYRSDPEVCRFQGYEPATINECREIIDWQVGKEFGPAGEWVKNALELKTQNKMIGDISLKPETEVRIVEFGISMSRDYQGRGFAAEALTAILNNLFVEKGVHRITAIMDVDNVAMITLAERLGFRREGHYIQSFFDNGEWRDEYFYALLRADWAGQSVPRAPTW
jgi:[ribosomal protein S5]-alanine N-acetyltransferase